LSTTQADQAEALRASKILIVDDEPINVKLARKYPVLEGYQNFILTTDSREAMSLTIGRSRTSCCWT
jgi:CheY-like chemotaxis protein